MRTLTYISGPPCSGKSTVAASVGLSIPTIELIRGDRFWLMYPDLPFEERVSVVNRHILMALEGSDSQNVLCEWVPRRGAFVRELKDICISRDRHLLHVALTTPLDVLKRRRMERDGDEDINPELQPDRQDPHGYLAFDTDEEDASVIAVRISDWILRGNRETAAGHREEVL